MTKEEKNHFKKQIRILKDYINCITIMVSKTNKDCASYAEELKNNIKWAQEIEAKQIKSVSSFFIFIMKPLGSC